MSARNPIGAPRAARFEKMRGYARGFAARVIPLIALGAVGLVEEPNATAAWAVAFAFGGLLLIFAVAVKRGSNEPRNCLVQSRRVRLHPARRR